MRRYLANYTIYKSDVYRQHIWSFDGEKVACEPFDIETPNTVFLDGVLVVGNEKMLKGEQVEAIKHLVELDTKETIAKVTRYMQENGLALSEGEKVGALEVNCVTKEVVKLKI